MADDLATGPLTERAFAGVLTRFECCEVGDHLLYVRIVLCVSRQLGDEMPKAL